MALVVDGISPLFGFLMAFGALGWENDGDSKSPSEEDPRHNSWNSKVVLSIPPPIPKQGPDRPSFSFIWASFGIGWGIKGGIFEAYEQQLEDTTGTSRIPFKSSLALP